MKIIENLQPTEVKAHRTYRIEHLPEIDVIVNLDYSNKEDQKVIIEILRKSIQSSGGFFYDGCFKI